MESRSKAVIEGTYIPDCPPEILAKLSNAREEAKKLGKHIQNTQTVLQDARIRLVSLTGQLEGYAETALALEDLNAPVKAPDSVDGDPED